MNTGMLWFDSSDALLSIKIQKAASYYEKKFGKTPNLAFVNPGILDESERKGISLGNISIRPYRIVLPNHIWIGIEDK